MDCGIIIGGESGRRHKLGGTVMCTWMFTGILSIVTFLGPTGDPVVRWLSADAESPAAATIGRPHSGEDARDKNVAEIGDN